MLQTPTIPSEANNDYFRFVEGYSKSVEGCFRNTEGYSTRKDVIERIIGKQSRNA